MMRAALPNDWEVIEAKVADGGIILKVGGVSNLCYSSKSFGRVYSEVLVLEKNEDSKKAGVWSKHTVECQ